MINNFKTRDNIFRIIQNLYGILIILFCVFPFLWMIATSLKVPDDIFLSPPKFYTGRITLQNFVTAVTKNNLLIYFKNSLIITLSTVIITIIFAALGSFAIGYLKLKYTKIIVTFLVAIQMLPSVISIVPLYIMCAKLHLLDTYQALIFSYLGGTVPVSIILLNGFFTDVPSDIGDAAKIDGCTTWQLFLKIILPISIPGIVASSIYTFIRIWQEFIIALSFTSKKEMYTLTIGLRAYEGSNQTDWGGLMATAVVISIPALILFAIVQKQFIDSMSGSVKG